MNRNDLRKAYVSSIPDAFIDVQKITDDLLYGGVSLIKRSVCLRRFKRKGKYPFKRSIFPLFGLPLGTFGVRESRENNLVQFLDARSSASLCVLTRAKIAYRFAASKYAFSVICVMAAVRVVESEIFHRGVS